LGEHYTQAGEVVCDEITVQALGELAQVSDWREDRETRQRFAVINTLTQVIETPLLLAPDMDYFSVQELQPWLHRPVFERDQAGQGSFLTEFRPCAALFVRFLGIDYDRDEAGKQLDTFIRQAQAIVTRRGGTFFQITIGDKGSYAYINFGALSAHEDDARRAVRVALELRDAVQELGFLHPLQIGITQGVLRVGAFGGPTRKTFGAMGDDVNLAARLMTNASPGEILVSVQVQKAVEREFVFEPRPPMPIKGKSEPLPVFAVTGERRQRAIRLQEPDYALPMVGRITELQIIKEKLDLVASGKEQVIGIVAEAGIGKSRLVAEVIRIARKKGFVGYGGACQSDGVNTPYLVWKPIWSAFFGVDPELPFRKQLHLLENEIEDRVPERILSMPLLSIMLDFEIPDNDFTRPLGPQDRKGALHILLEDCLKVATKDEPILIVIEDLHWIDTLSSDLLEELAKALSDCPICFVLAYRPPRIMRLAAPRLEALSNFTRIELRELNRIEVEQAIRAKLAQLYPAQTGAVPSQLANKLMARAQGNPFFLEELLNYLRDRGLDPHDPADIDKIDLPHSLHMLILSRIDQLSEREKTTLRVASIIGRFFRATWLAGYYPALGELSHVKVDLDRLHTLDITPLDPSEPELAYLFKHIVTHEVTYESLPFSLRGQLHEQLARYLEKQITDGTLSEAPLLDTLVYHFTRSENHIKKRFYLEKAAQAAFNVSAFYTAVEYLSHLLELIPESDPDRVALLLKLAEAHSMLSDFPAARSTIGQAQAAAKTDADRAAALAQLGQMLSILGNYAEAQTISTAAVPLARASGGLTLCRALYTLGDVEWRMGKLDNAKVALDESLTLAREMGDVTRELFALNRLATMAKAEGNLAEAEHLLTEVHTHAVAVGNRERAQVALNNLGEVAKERKNYTLARDNYRQALVLAREVGNQLNIALFLINLAEIDIRLMQLESGHARLKEGMALALRIGALAWIVTAVMCFANLAYTEGQIERALMLLGLACHQPACSSDHLRDMNIYLAEWALDSSVVDAEMRKGETLDWEITIKELLKG
jgi:tetratricopeptide (TPR) repeat protein